MQPRAACGALPLQQGSAQAELAEADSNGARLAAKAHSKIAAMIAFELMVLNRLKRNRFIPGYSKMNKD